MKREKKKETPPHLLPTRARNVVKISLERNNISYEGNKISYERKRRPPKKKLKCAMTNGGTRNIHSVFLWLQTHKAPFPTWQPLASEITNISPNQVIFVHKEGCISFFFKCMYKFDMCGTLVPLKNKHKSEANRRSLLILFPSCIQPSTVKPSCLSQHQNRYQAQLGPKREGPGMGVTTLDLGCRQSAGR